MYIVLVPFDWTRALSPVCFLFVHNSIEAYTKPNDVWPRRHKAKIF